MFASNLKLRIPAARPGTRNLSKRIISIPRSISWDFSGLVNQWNPARLVFVSAHEFNQLEPMGAMRSEQRKSELDDPADSDETKTRNIFSLWWPADTLRWLRRFHLPTDSSVRHWRPGPNNYMQMMTPTRVRVMWLIIAVNATFLLGARQFFSGAPSRDGHKPWTQLPHSVLITRRGQAGRVLHF